MDKQRNSQPNCNETLELNDEKLQVRPAIDSTNEDSLKSNSSTSSSLKSCSPSEEAISKDLNNEHSESIEHLLNTEDQNFETFPVPDKIIPSFNVPERIVLCIDTVNDLNEHSYKANGVDSHSILSMIRKIIEIFLYNKLYINRQHQFALVLLKQQNVLWCKDFTSDPKEILIHLNELVENDKTDHFDLSTLFNEIEQHVRLPSVTDSQIVPLHNVRVILLYNRSYCIPKFISGKDSFNRLRASSYFTVDILYIHEEEPENKCKEIFQFLSDLDKNNDSFVLNVTKNFNTLCDNMAKLLAHPLQRPLQKVSNYKIPEIKTT